MCATSIGPTATPPAWWPTSMSAHRIRAVPGSRFRWNSSRTKVVGSSRRVLPTSCWHSGTTPSSRRRHRVADRVWIGWLEFDLLLGDVRSLKQKRSLVRPVIAELQRKFNVSVAETGSHDLHRRANIGVAMASPDRAHAVHVLDAAEPP